MLCNFRAFDYDLPPPPTMKKNKKGKLLKTRLREEEVVRTLLSADTSKYIEATTFKEPGAPHSKFFIDIPKDSCSEPKFRYCDPHKNRTIVGPVRHELLIGLMHKHTLYLCPRDGEVGRYKYHSGSLPLLHILSGPCRFHLQVIEVCKHCNWCLSSSHISCIFIRSVWVVFILL